MGWYVHLHACFPCDRNEPVAWLAAQHLIRRRRIRGRDGLREARWFLESLSRRRGRNPGPKGGLSLWGIVGNCTRGKSFVYALYRFWVDLLTARLPGEWGLGGPNRHDRILVFEEPEQSGRAIAWEIGLDENRQDRLVIRRHACPFSWRQM